MFLLKMEENAAYFYLLPVNFNLSAVQTENVNRSGQFFWADFFPKSGPIYPKMRSFLARVGEALSTNLRLGS